MRVAYAILLLLPILLAACDQQMEHMPRIDPLEQQAEVPSIRLPVEGTVARDADLTPVAQDIPFPITMEVLEHGRERFNIFCSPCHDRTGHGNGIVVRRGFPSPPDFHSPALRQVSNRHIYDVITDGYGVMYSYAARVPPADRWAIAAYIRALQLSWNAPARALPAQSIEQLEAQQ